MWKAEAEAAAHGNFRDDTGSTLCICFIFVVGMQSGVTHEEAEDGAKKRKKQQIDKQFMAFCVKMKNENTIESESNKRRNGIKNCTKQ